jgi:hypothetical protein
MSWELVEVLVFHIILLTTLRGFTMIRTRGRMGL